MAEPESFYTDEMKSAHHKLPNDIGIQYRITVMEDDEGKFLCIVFLASDLEKLGQPAAQHLVNVRTVLRQYARVTFWSIGD